MCHRQMVKETSMRFKLNEPYATLSIDRYNGNLSHMHADQILRPICLLCNESFGRLHFLQINDEQIHILKASAELDEQS